MLPVKSISSRIEFQTNISSVLFEYILDFCLQILLGHKEKDAGVENAINLWGEQKIDFPKALENIHLIYHIISHKLLLQSCNSVTWLR